MSTTAPAVPIAPAAPPQAASWRVMRYFFALEFFFTIQLLGFAHGKEKIVFAMLSAPLALYLFQATEKAYRAMLVFAVVTFVVGQRTIFLSDNTRVVPGEVLIWALALLCIPLKRETIYKHMPVPMVVLIIGLATAWGVQRAAINRMDLDIAFAYAKGFWLAVPAFFVCYRLLRSLEQVRSLLTILTFQCLFLSFFTIGEYFSFGFMRYFPPPPDFSLVDMFDFHRAYCAFWGNPMLAGILAYLFPLMTALTLHSKGPAERVLFSIAMALSLYAIYLSGHRGVWIPWIGGMGYFLSQRGPRGKMLAIVIVVVCLASLPKTGMNRLAGVFSETQDTSTLERMHRATWAWELIKGEPFIGRGWGAAGLAHTDWLQVWSDAGFALFASLIALFIMTGRKLARALDHGPPAEGRDYLYALRASLLCLFGIIGTQTFLNLPEQWPPLWFLLALAYHYPEVLAHEGQVAKS